MSQRDTGWGPQSKFLYDQGTLALLALPERRSHRYYKRHVKIPTSSYASNPGRRREQHDNAAKLQEEVAI